MKALRRFVLATLLSPIAAVLLGAAPAGAEPPAGRPYSPGPFDSIEISGSASVSFTQGDTDQVFVSGSDSAQRAVSLDLRGRRLEIRPSGSWKFWAAERLQVDIVARDLRRVSISGAADLHAPGPLRLGRLTVHISGAGSARFDALTADTLDFGISGSGDGQAAGRVERLQVNISGRGDFDGEALAAKRARVRVSGIGDVEVWALEELDVSVSGVGSVDYWGQPKLRRSASGLAEINDRGPRPAPPP